MLTVTKIYHLVGTVIYVIIATRTGKYTKGVFEMFVVGAVLEVYMDSAGAGESKEWQVIRVLAGIFSGFFLVFLMVLVTTAISSLEQIEDGEWGVGDYFERVVKNVGNF